MAGSWLGVYFPVLVFLGVALGVAMAAVLLSFILAKRRPYAAKNAPYECGFEAFADARAPFRVRFFLVALLFVLFDIEIAFLFPWALALREIGWEGFAVMGGFLALLGVGFVYEWKKGALEWM